MNPEQVWDAFAAKFGQDVATQKLGARPSSAPTAPPTGTVFGGPEPTQESHEGAIRAMGQGFFGLGDEIRSGVQAVGALVPGGRSPGEAWRETMDSEAAAQQKWATDHPAGNMAAQVLGGVATGGLIGKGAASLAGRVAGKIAPEASEAVAGGLAKLRGPKASMAATAKTLATGGVVGGATAFGAANGDVGERIEAVPAGIGWGVGLTAAIGGGARAAGAGADLLDLRSPEGVRDRARQILLEWMKKDETTVSKMGENLHRLRGPVAPPEGAGQNVRRLVGVIESKPGRGANNLRNTVTERQGQAPTRIDKDIRDAVGVDAGDLEGELERRTADQKAKAGPLYDKIENVSIKDKDGTITEVLELPEFRAAYKEAEAIARTEGKPLKPLYDEDGKVLRGSGAPAIPIRAFDYVKKGLDGVIETGFEGRPVSRARARALKGRLRTMLAQVDELMPEYKTARATWGGDEAAKEAFEEGYGEFRTMEPEAVARRMTQANADEFRLGVARWLREEAGGATARSGSQNLAGKVMGSGDRKLWAPGSESKIRSVFGDKDPEAFLRGMESEGAIHQTFGQMGGSRTAPLLENSNELERGLGAMESAGRAARGDIGALGSVLRWVRQSRAAGFNERTMAELADMLTAGMKDPNDLEKLLAELRAAEKGARGPNGAAAAGIVGGLRAHP